MHIALPIGTFVKIGIFSLKWGLVDIYELPLLSTQFFSEFSGIRFWFIVLVFWQRNLQCWFEFILLQFPFVHLCNISLVICRISFWTFSNFFYKITYVHSSLALLKVGTYFSFTNNHSKLVWGDICWIFNWLLNFLLNFAT